jgi:hypothetical protein
MARRALEIIPASLNSPLPESLKRNYSVSSEEKTAFYTSF